MRLFDVCRQATPRKVNSQGGRVQSMTYRSQLRLLFGSGGCVAAVMLAWAAAAMAQPELQDCGQVFKAGSLPKPKFTTTLTPASAKPGDMVTLSIHAKLPDHYYIYATTGLFDGRTRINAEPSGLEAVDEDFVADREPQSVIEPLFDNAEILKFYDRVTWKRRYRIKADANPEKVSVTGELSGQYCSEGTDEVPGNCIPIIPVYEFDVTLSDDDEIPTPSFSHEERPNRGKNSPAVLKFLLSPSDAGPGDKVALSITMDLDEDWHTFSLTQNGEGGEPTVIELESLNGLKAIGDEFKPNHSPELASPDPALKLEVHYESVTWSREFEVLPGTAPGNYGVRGQISYQTCKNICIPPKPVKFLLGVVAESAPDKFGDTNTACNEPTKREQKVNVNPKPDEDPNPNQKIAKRPQDKGLLAFLLTAVGFGLVSLLTPCVFPMVPITVSFFLKQSEKEHHQPLAVASVFCLSIVATFTVLGVGIAAIFGAAQLNALANNPWLNIAIGSVFVAFALNMLGLFEIRISSELLTFTSTKEQAGGYVGAVFMALTFTLTSFTCTFAFAGTLLVAAAHGEFYWPIIGMLAFGSAFASPFFFLAIMPSMLKSLPKSGGWMNLVKVIMGLIEIGAAVKFFSVADLTWNPEPIMFDFVFVMIAWLVLSLVMAMYLLGVFRMSNDVPSQGISVARLIAAMAFIGLSCNLAVGLITHERGGGWIMDQIIAFAPPRFEYEAVVEKGGPPTDHPEPVIAHHSVWFSLDVDKGIEFAKSRDLPMLFDFTGVNCINCRLMEKKMAEPAIRALLDRLVRVQLYVDKVPVIRDSKEASRILKRNVGLQTGWFGDVTLPSYAVVTPDGKTILGKYEGLEQREGDFAAFLEAGLNKWEESK